MGIHASVRSVLKSAPPRRPRLVTASASVQYPEMQRVASHGRRHRTWVPAFRGPQFKIMFKIRSKIRLKIQYTVLIYSTVQRSQPFSRSCSAFWERRVVSWTYTLDFLIVCTQLGSIDTWPHMVLMYCNYSSLPILTSFRISAFLLSTL